MIDAHSVLVDFFVEAYGLCSKQNTKAYECRLYLLACIAAARYILQNTYCCLMCFIWLSFSQKLAIFVHRRKNKLTMESLQLLSSEKKLGFTRRYQQRYDYLLESLICSILLKEKAFLSESVKTVFIYEAVLSSISCNMLWVQDI